MKVLITSSKGKEKLVKAFEDAGAEIVTSLPADLIIPTVDEELPFFSQNIEWFKKQGTQVMVSNPETIFHCRDKAEFNLWLGRHGFATPRTYQRNEILKPRFGKGSQGIIKVNPHKYIYQEDYSQFPEVSVDYFADFEGKAISILPRYRLGVVNGESTELKYVEDFDFDVIRRLGKELRLVGHNVIQGFLLGNVLAITEVNPRYGGGSHMTFKDFNSPKWLVENSACILMKK